MSASASVGLCATCKHVRVIRSDRGAVFYFCSLSAVDSNAAAAPNLIDVYRIVACSRRGGAARARLQDWRARRATCGPRSGSTCYRWITVTTGADRGELTRTMRAVESDQLIKVYA